MAVARKNQRAETRLVDEDGSSLVVGTRALNQGGGFVIIIYMLSQSRPSADGHGVSYIFSVHSTVAYKGKDHGHYEDLKTHRKCNWLKSNHLAKKPYNLTTLQPYI